MDHAPIVEAAIRDATGSAFALTGLTPVHGGSIHTCYRAEGTGGPFFVKIGAADCAEPFAAEVDGLDSLRRAGAFAVPQVIGCASDVAHAWLILEHLALSPLSTREHGRAAGEALARLHRVTGDHYGWHRDNWLGRTPQPNAPCPTWAAFLAERRLGPLFERAAAAGHADMARDGRRLLERIPALLVDHRPPKALLHGDLWHGNIGVLADGRIAVFDPAVSYGDAQFDLAMSMLFGGFPDSFYAAYRAEHPPTPGYELRDALYRLYHVLNHLVLFGRGYLGEAQRLCAYCLRSGG